MAESPGRGATGSAAQRGKTVSKSARTATASRPSGLKKTASASSSVVPSTSTPLFHYQQVAREGRINKLRSYPFFNVQIRELNPNTGAYSQWSNVDSMPLWMASPILQQCGLLSGAAGEAAIVQQSNDGTTIESGSKLDVVSAGAH